ncbi:MAG: hypothetical protein HN350_11535 [Phycisphaerales bacterium]|nr:hypothetical protein [Phycisphaerales bacterium]
MKNIAKHTLRFVVAVGVGLMISGCASTQIKQLSGPDFAARAKQMELVSSFNWTAYIGASTQRAYLECGHPAFIGSGTQTTIFWTPLSDLPEDLVTKLKAGNPPWKPWRSKTNKP